MRARRGRHTVLISLLGASLVSVSGPAWCQSVDATDAFETTHSLVGSYLAGRLARSENDPDDAAAFYRSTLEHDPNNELLLEQAFQLEVSRADWPRAFKLAGQLASIQKQNRLAQLALALNDFKSGDYKKSEDHFKRAGSGPIGELTSALAIAWVKYAEGDVNGALAALELPKQAEWAQFYLRYHRALIADLAGRKQEARIAYERTARQDARTLRTALAYARHAINAGDRKLALSIVKEQVDKSQGDGHPLLRSLRESIDRGGKVPLIVDSAAEGMAEVFYGLGEALIGEGAAGIGVIYLQMALYAEPNHQFALAALANAYEANKQYADAIEAYNRIPDTSPLSVAVEIRKALNLNSLERVDEARDTLTRLLNGPASNPQAGDDAAKAQDANQNTTNEAIDETPLKGKLSLSDKGDQVKKLQEALQRAGYSIGAIDGAFGESTLNAVRDFQKKSGMKVDGVVGKGTYAAILKANGADGAAAEAGPRPQLSAGDKLEILDSLGNIMRAHKMYAEAIPYYDQALSLVDKPDKRHWVYYYARGTSYERLKNWPAAEADLEKALALYPDQPLILNYLGYSWIDQGRNLKEGMAHIEKAVALKPDDGYIVDSLGWAHYKQGNFKEAVRYLERAVELKPDDAVLNDHLGDALWRVGREREARYQWDQALSLKPEPEDLEKIRKKIEAGLTNETDKPVAASGKQAAQTHGDDPVVEK
jgi:tetratricopeptide (TPR) repeat protein